MLKPVSNWWFDFRADNKLCKCLHSFATVSFLFLHVSMLHAFTLRLLDLTHIFPKSDTQQ